MEKQTVHKVGEHTLNVNGRSGLRASGICEVESYDGNMVVALCEGFRVAIQGSALKVSGFGREKGELTLEGRVDAVQYVESAPRGGSALKRLFR